MGRKQRLKDLLEKHGVDKDDEILMEGGLIDPNVLTVR
jgi:hypothetical protein